MSWSDALRGMFEMIELMVSNPRSPDPGSPWVGCGNAGRVSPGLQTVVQLMHRANKFKETYPDAMMISRLRDCGTP